MHIYCNISSLCRIKPQHPVSFSFLMCKSSLLLKRCGSCTIDMAQGYIFPPTCPNPTGNVRYYEISFNLPFYSLWAEWVRSESRRRCASSKVFTKWLNSTKGASRPGRLCFYFHDRKPNPCKHALLYGWSSPMGKWWSWTCSEFISSWAV